MGRSQLDVAAAPALRDKPCAASHRLHLGGATVGVRREAERAQCAIHFGGEGASWLLVDADDGETKERQAVEEIDEGTTKVGEVLAIGFEMVAVDVGDHRQGRMQVQERGIALVGLGDHVRAAAEGGATHAALAGCVGGSAEQPAADDVGGVETRFGKEGSDHARGGGLAVGAGDGNADSVPHQLAEHLRPRDHGDATRAGTFDFGVVGGDGARGHDDIGRPADIEGGGRVADAGGGAERRQMSGRGGRHEIGTGHLMAFPEQHLGDAGHAGAADADEVDAPHAAQVGCRCRRHVCHVRTLAAETRSRLGASSSMRTRSANATKALETSRLLPP